MARNPFDVVMEDRKKLVDRIIENMEKGELSWNKNWNAGALQPQNPVSNVKYQGVNKLKLMMTAIEKDYKDPRWVTFKQAFDNGWKIKKGEKAVLCEKWIFTKKEIEIDEQGNKIEKEVKLDKPIPNFFYVFNGEQIEKIPELKLQNELEKSEITEIAQDFINSSECKIKEIAQDRAFYNPSTDEIILPLRESFKSEQDFLATTLHEMVHSTGHKDRLDRDLSGTFGSEKYAKEELTAELGAMFLQSKLGIKIEGEHFDNHSAYLKSWIETLKKDPNELFRAANNADKATEMLYGRYIEKQQEELKEIKEAEVRKEAAIENRKKELEQIIKEVTEKEIPRGNYNCFSGNEIIMPNHKSNDKRWIRVEDVEKNNIKVNENERPILTVLTGKNEKGNLKVTTVEFYNVSQLEITKEIEKKFVPMKQKAQEKTVEKSKDKGVGIGD